MSQVHEGFADDFSLENRIRSTDRPESERLEVLEVEEVPAYYKRRSAGVWACLASLTIILAVVVAYGYAVLNQENMQLEQLPGIAKSLSAIGQHLGNVERRVADSSVDQQNLAAQIRGIGAESKVAISLTQQQTASMVAHVQETLLRRVNQQTSILQPELAQLLRDRSLDRQRLAQLERQLTEARYELDSTRADNVRQAEAFRQLQDELHRELASIGTTLTTPVLDADIQTTQVAGSSQ